MSSLPIPSFTGARLPPAAKDRRQNFVGFLRLGLGNEHLDVPGVLLGRNAPGAKLNKEAFLLQYITQGLRHPLAGRDVNDCPDGVQASFVASPAWRPREARRQA